MSSRESDWGLPDVRGGDPALGSSPSGASPGLQGVLENFVRLPGFGKLITRGKAGDLSAGAKGGVDIDRVNRAVLGPLDAGKIAPSHNYLITSTSFVEVDSYYLAGTMACSGRPVRIDVAGGVNIGSSTGIILSAMMDGADVSGYTFNGLAWTYTGGDVWLSGWHLMTPPAGLHRFALAARVDSLPSGTGGVIYGDTINPVKIMVMEI